MSVKTVFLIAILSVYRVNGAVLLWSNHKFEISPLRGFSDDNFEELIQDLGYPEVTVYKSSPALLPEFEQYLKGYYTAYNANGELSVENATEIWSQDDLSQLETKLRLDGNLLSVLVIPNGRSKREITSTTTEQGTNVSYKTSTSKGPVFYHGKLLKDTGTFGLLYSSEPLLLKTNNASLLLGNTSDDMVSVDTISKETVTRLSLRVPTDDDNNLVVTLRFIFSWSNGYWSLTSVKISDTHNLYSFNLTTSQKITAPARFSYHCSGETVFSYSNSSVTAELYITNIQTQPDSPDGNFNDAYDCIDFTTGPILSGLFVTAILGIGLIIGLICIIDIKTMDKFDNQKTKQLVITVAD